MSVSVGIHAPNKSPLLEDARHRYLSFLQMCQAPDGSFRLTPLADPSVYATCFWVFGMHLLQQEATLIELRKDLATSIRQAVRDSRAAALLSNTLGEKAYRQLLCFALSALSTLGVLAEDPLEDLVKEQLPASPAQELDRYGCFFGRAQSGNQAMFMAVFLLHARDTLGMDMSASLDTWV